MPYCNIYFFKFNLFLIVIRPFELILINTLISKLGLVFVYESELSGLLINNT